MEDTEVVVLRGGNVLTRYRDNSDVRLLYLNSLICHYPPSHTTSTAPN